MNELIADKNFQKGVSPIPIIYIRPEKLSKY